MLDSEWSGQIPDDDDYGRLDYNYRAACLENGGGRLYNETVEILWSWTDGQDEPHYSWLVKFKDGRFALVEGWHDYTGWDCQSGVEVCHVGESEAECAGYLTDDPRRAYAERNN